MVIALHGFGQRYYCVSEFRSIRRKWMFDRETRDTNGCDVVVSNDGDGRIRMVRPGDCCLNPRRGNT